MSWLEQFFTDAASLSKATEAGEVIIATSSGTTMRGHVECCAEGVLSLLRDPDEYPTHISLPHIVWAKFAED